MSLPIGEGNVRGITPEGGVSSRHSKEEAHMTALVVYLQNTIARLRERQEGQTMAEYALILGGIAVVVIAGILILGPAIRDLFQSTGSSVKNFPSS